MCGPAFSGTDETAAVAAATARCPSTGSPFTAIQQCGPSPTTQTSLPAHAASPSAFGLYGL